MVKARHPRPNAQDTSPEAHIQNDRKTQEALLKAGALQNAILNSANFSSIATDAKGVIQIFNIGAERMLGYEAADGRAAAFLVFPTGCEKSWHR